MKAINRSIIALLLTLALSASCVSLAAEPNGQVVDATLWDEWYITVDETPICVANEHDRVQYPLGYNGSIYIPLQTASEWLGAEFNWDKSSNTITLSKTGAPYYRHRTLPNRS